jgi:LysM repeat protein
MKWRHWSILIVLALLNYIIFSTAFTQLAQRRRPQLFATRTPQPTFVAIDAGPVSWIVLPTSTSFPTLAPVTLVPTTPLTSTVDSTPPAGSAPPTDIAASATPLPVTELPLPPTPTPTAPSVAHIVQEGETLSQIAAQYGVSLEALVAANGLANADQIAVGQQLIIPAAGAVPPTSTPVPQPTKKPTPKPTKKPAPPTATQPPPKPQFTAEVIWDPLVAPNCNGPAISKQSTIRDTAGNPVNGVVVEVNCYDNIFPLRPSGNPGEYDPGHYDFSPGQSSPQDWTCTARVVEIDGQPVTSSEVVSIHFDTNDCEPDGSGHQIAIVNWTKNR